MNELSDQDLVERARRGDVSALNSLIKRYIGPLYRFVLRVCGEPAAAEDIVQETCLKIWRKLNTFQPERSFKAWAFTIARNTAFDYLKKRRAIPFSQIDEHSGLEEPFHDRIEDERPLPPELIERKDQGELIDQALSELSEKSRSVIILHESEDLTFQEIAQLINEPSNTVKSRYRRALLSLRGKIERLLSRTT